ncbi:hypothetical protein [Mesorhizobium sp. WSM4982]|uniref:hypothetical protein n=1 Tax=Mesorhizobium sp. WSM4982 TaxID=3038550 RepID=UPI0024150D36|nr:hypothetical protein [Mesorhizobium sp. WSM4982]MDG4856443.1 hypothetical protein [Mesorhizobium sp. WSM4982]
MIDHYFDPMPTKPGRPRGRGIDRRPIITIDGRNYMREGRGPEVARVAALVEAKRMAWDTALVLGELAGVVLIVGSLTLLCVGLVGAG